MKKLLVFIMSLFLTVAFSTGAFAKEEPKKEDKNKIAEMKKKKSEEDKKKAEEAKKKKAEEDKKVKEEKGKRTHYLE